MPDDGYEEGNDDAPEVDDDEEVVELVSSGESCPQCEALDGMCFAEDATPIHEWCDCEVEMGELRRGRESVPERECGDNEWELNFNMAGYPGDDRIGPVTSWWDLIVHCWNGEVLTVEVTVSHEPGTDPDLIEDEAWSELYDEAEEIAATECPPCDPLIVS